MNVRGIVNRLLGRPAGKRSLDGAAGGRRWKGVRTFGRINDEILTQATPLRQRGQYFARNNPWLANGVNALVAALVGTGLKPQSSHPDAGVRGALHRAWRRWCDVADADGRTDFGGLQALAVRNMIEHGDAFAQYLVDLLVSGSGNGPTLADTKALFHADHSNKAGSGAAPAEATLTAARLAMRKQKGLAGEIIDIAPRYILTPPDLETTVEKLLTAVRAATTDDVAVFAGRLTLVVEPRLVNSARWYLCADPAQADGLEWCVVEGMEGPTVTTERDFDTDGLKIKVLGTLGAGFVDHRSWFMNPGV